MNTIFSSRHPRGHKSEGTSEATTVAGTPALKTKRRRRAARTATGIVAGVTVLMTGVGPASAHTVRVFADPAGATYTYYEGPGTNHRPLGTVSANQQVAIACTTRGQSVTGRFGATTVWDYIPRKGYISDAYINTGQSGPVGPQCSSATAGHYDWPYMNSTGWSQAGLTLLCGELKSTPQFNPPSTLDRCWGIYSDRPGLHREGRALDYRMNAFNANEKAVGDALAEYLKTNAPSYGVQEIIWNNRAWDVRFADWQPYDAVRQCGSDSPTCRHEDHLHIGMNWAGAAAKTKRWEMIIDNYGIQNDRNTTRVVPTASWTPSSYSSQRWATGYNFATADEGNDSDNFTFSFYLDRNEPKTKWVEAWWNSSASRNSTVPFVIKNAQGVELNRKFVDQKLNGGKWNSLGRYTFTEGWNTIAVSRSTPLANGQHIIADAVRIVGT